MRTVTVVGHGSATAAPDSAEVRLSVVHHDPDLSAALAGAESAREAAVATARRYVEPSRVGSTNLSVHPAHDYEGRRADGFEARHSLTIRCDDLEQAGPLVTALVADVGPRLQVGSVSLVVSDPAEARLTARERAYADAVARAEHLAGLAGAALGPVQSVTEGGHVQDWAEDDMIALAAGGPEASFEPGRRAISVSLRVTFELAPAG